MGSVCSPAGDLPAEKTLERDRWGGGSDIQKDQLKETLHACLSGMDG